MKAFDSISHRSLWDALGHCEIEPQYVGLFEETLRETAKICFDKKRERCVRNREGTKQGDPLSRSLQKQSVRNSTER